MVFRIISLFLLLMTCSRGHSQHAVTNTIRPAWENILELRPDKALAYLQTLEPSDPANPRISYYQHYALFLNALIAGDITSYGQFTRQGDILTRIIQNSDPHNPEYLYFLSSMHLQKTFLNVYYGEYWQGIRNLFAARRMAIQNSISYPGFIPNLKTEGITGLLISSVPDNYKWIFNWFGLNADLPEATCKLEQYCSACSAEEKPEALIILSLAYGQFLADREKAYRLMKESDTSYVNKPAPRLIMAYYAAKAGYASEAVRLLEPAAGPDEAYCSHPALLFGILKLCMLEQDAGSYLEYFLHHYNGINLVRTTLHYLSWYYFIQGDTARYRHYRQMVLLEGSDLLISDRQAAAEASEDSLPDLQLLQVRLLFDGGMYDRALEMLYKINQKELDPGKDVIEYNYRLARICHKRSMTDRAKESYRKVLAESNDPDAYFAPYSALQLGLIAEQEGKYDEANRYYKTALEINRGQYRSEIAKETKAGLERIKNY